MNEIEPVPELIPDPAAWISMREFNEFNQRWELEAGIMRAQIEEWRKRAWDAETKLRTQIEENIALRGVVMENKKLEKIIAEQAYKFQFEKMTLWEEHLRLLIRPKARWMPGFFYRWMVRQTLRQEIQKIPKRCL